MTSSTVVGMTCGRCVDAVTEEVGQVPGVAAVHVDLTTGGLTVTSGTGLDEEAVRAAVEESGHELAGTDAWAATLTGRHRRDPATVTSISY